MFPDKLKEKIAKDRIIAVLEIDEVKSAVSVARALIEGGVSIIELTLRTTAAMESLIQIKKQVPEMIVGVGTVLNREQLKEIADVGADFGVAPGMNPLIVETARQLDFPFAPGVITPSELERAVELGCNVLKFFPAEPSGGLKYLKSMAGPYNHLGLKYIPLGGLNLQNAQSYLESSLVIGIGGSWIAKRDIIQKEDWQAITQNARLVMKLVEELRGG